MTKLEKLYSIIENSRDVGVKLPKGVLQQVEELEEGIIKEEILPALSSDYCPKAKPHSARLAASGNMNVTAGTSTRTSAMGPKLKT